MKVRKAKLESWTLDYVHYLYPDNQPKGDNLAGWSRLFKETDFKSPEALAFKAKWEQEHRLLITIGDGHGKRKFGSSVGF